MNIKFRCKSLCVDALLLLVALFFCQSTMAQVASQFYRINSVSEYNDVNKRHSDKCMIVAKNTPAALVLNDNRDGFVAATVTKSPDGTIVYAGTDDVTKRTFQAVTTIKSTSPTDAYYVSVDKYLTIASTGISLTDDVDQLYISFSSGDIVVQNKTKKYYLGYDAKNNKFKSYTTKPSGDNAVQLYIFDTFDFNISEDFSPESNSITITASAGDVDNGYTIKAYGLANDGADVSETTLLMSANLIHTSSANEFSYTLPLVSDDENYVRPTTFWLKLTLSSGSNVFCSSRLIKFDLSGLPLASGFEVPSVDGLLEDDLVVFTRDNDVKIFYTLDGSDPLVTRNVGNALVRRMPALNTSAYDLDVRPLTLKDVNENDVVWRAVRTGSLPSEPQGITGSGNTTSLGKIAVDGIEPPVYFNLQGTRLEGKPTVPGIYIRRALDGTSRKVWVR